MSSTVRFQCPRCQFPLSASADHAGQTAKCPKCREPITVPGTAAPAARVMDLVLLSDAEDAAARSAPPKRRLIVTTGYDVPGRTITEVLGVVRGIVVRALSIPQALVGTFERLKGELSMDGADIEKFAEMCDRARHSAYRKMVKNAAEKGAHAIIGMRFDAAEFAQYVTEVLAYGTAVKLSDPRGQP